MTVAIRRRGEKDLPASVAALRLVHHADAYPSNWPLDPAAFLTPPGLLGAWVAARGEEVVGHVALRSAESTSCGRVIPEATGFPAAGLAVVSRLLVVPAARSAGLGQELIAAALEAAAAQGMRGALDVHADAKSAVALYERLGWSHVATRTERYPGGEEFSMRYYLAPNRRSSAVS